MGSIIFLGNLGNVYAYKCGLIRERDPKKYILYEKMYVTNSPNERIPFIFQPASLYFWIHHTWKPFYVQFRTNIHIILDIYSMQMKKKYIQWDYIYFINNVKNERVPFIFQLASLFVIYMRNLMLSAGSEHLCHFLSHICYIIDIITNPCWD